MQRPFLDLLCPALVPKLGADIAAGTPGNVHFILPAVAAAWAFPYQFPLAIVYNTDLAVKPADLAVVAFGI